MKRALAVVVACLAFAAPFVAVADAPDAGAGKDSLSCAEHIPAGATRPKLTEHFPDKGVSGYAVSLDLEITHGKGETPMPEGFRVTAGMAAKALADAEFMVPDPDGGAGPQMVTTPGDTESTTKLSISFVPLPMLPGRRNMELPPVPIAVQRAGGEIMTVCTSPHPIVVDEPIAGVKDPPVTPNAPPRKQREEWVLAKLVTIGILIGVVIGAIIGLFIRKLKNAPVAPTPEPPKRLPWVIALEELEALKSSELLTEGKHDVFMDRVSDCVRRYLGLRYGFDGLETTTDEMRGVLRRVRPAVPDLNKIAGFLGDCDLVKFAKVSPSREECLDAHKRGGEIIRMTIPTPVFPAASKPEPMTPSLSLAGDAKPADKPAPAAAVAPPPADAPVPTPAPPPAEPQKPPGAAP